MHLFHYSLTKNSSTGVVSYGLIFLSAFQRCQKGYQGVASSDDTNERCEFNYDLSMVTVKSRLTSRYWSCAVHHPTKSPQTSLMVIAQSWGTQNFFGYGCAAGNFDYQQNRR